VQIRRNPFTGETSIVKEDDFIPLGGRRNMGNVGNMGNMGNMGGNGNIQQGFEQERTGIGQQGYVVIVVLSDEPILISL
jgi:hypothetical protein